MFFPQDLHHAIHYGFIYIALDAHGAIKHL